MFNSESIDGGTDQIFDFTHDGAENDRLDFRKLSVLASGQSEEDWIAAHITQAADNMVTIALSGLTVELVDHADLGSDFLSQVIEGLQL